MWGFLRFQISAIDDTIFMPGIKQEFRLLHMLL